MWLGQENHLHKGVLVIKNILIILEEKYFKTSTEYRMILIVFEPVC